MHLKILKYKKLDRISFKYNFKFKTMMKKSFFFVQIGSFCNIVSKATIDALHKKRIQFVEIYV